MRQRQLACHDYYQRPLSTQSVVSETAFLECHATLSERNKALRDICGGDCTIWRLPAVFRASSVTAHVTLSSRGWIEIRRELHWTAGCSLLLTREVKHVYCLWFEETHGLQKITCKN